MVRKLRTLVLSLLLAVPVLAVTAPPAAVAAAKPAVTKLSASSGPSTGGTRVTITGRHLTGVSSVRFGTRPGTHLKVRSATSLKVTTPAHAAGLVHVRLVSKHGTSTKVKVDRFRFTDWLRTALPRPADAASEPTVLQVSCWAALRCLAAGSYTDTSGDGQGALWLLSGKHWSVRRAPLPADAAADPGPIARLVSCGASGLCVVAAEYEAHRNGSDTHARLLWTLHGGTWRVDLPPVPPDADPGYVNVEVLACAEAVCTAEGNYASANEDNSVLWVGTGSGWTATKAPLPGDAHADPFDGITGLACGADGTCVASGYYFSDSGTGGALWRLSGSTWSVAAAALPPGVKDADLTSGSTPATCTAHGLCLVAIRVDLDGGGRGLELWSLEHGAWTHEPVPVPTDALDDTAYALTQLACSAAGTCTAGGTYADTDGDQQGLLWVRDGDGQWTATRAPLPANAAQNPRPDVRGLTCDGDGSCVSAGPYVYHANGQDMDEHGAVVRLVWALQGGHWKLVPPFAATPQDQMVFGLGCGAGACVARTYLDDPDHHWWRLWTLAGGRWSPFDPVAPAGAADPGVLVDGVGCGPAPTCVAYGRYQDATSTTRYAAWVYVG